MTGLDSQPPGDRTCQLHACGYHVIGNPAPPCGLDCIHEEEEDEEEEEEDEDEEEEEEGEEAEEEEAYLL